ncbi:MAG: ATP-binding protein [bacterium]|nr:ATP-binding protein [bacterium]
MNIILSFSLVIMATITMMLGVNVFIYDDINQKHNQYYVQLCGASSIWSFSYGCVGLIPDENISTFLRCLALFGVLFVIAKAVVLVSIWMEINEKIQKIIYVYVTIASLLIYPLIIDRDRIVFLDTPYGYYYTFEPFLGRSIFNYYVWSIVIIVGCMLVYGLHNMNKKRKRKMAKAIITCLLFFMFGMLFDTVLPLWGISSFPSSAIAQFISVVFVYIVSIRYNMSRMTLSNVSEYIYSLVDTPILILDEEEKIQIANTSSSMFFRLPTDQIIGRYLSDFFSMEQERVDSDGKKAVFANCLFNKAKCDLSVNEIKDRYDEYLGKIVVITDMTDKINLIEELDESREEAVRANKAKSAFLANMSHEIRTPMNTIIGMSELLLNKKLEAEVKQEVLLIRNAGSGLLYIINDILDISKIESGKFEIIESEYMLASLIVDVVNMMSVRLNDKGIYFLVKVDTRLPAHLIGDDLRIKQILINIIGNAIKFTHKGYIQVSISGKYEKPEELTLIIEVEDSGIGIKKEDIPSLFGIFNQVDTRRNRKITGTGLGLAISKNLCELMRGSIEVESEYGQGTVFTIALKQKVKQVETVASIEDKDKIQIILYESDPIMINYFTTTFDEMGLNYFLCTNFEQVKRIKQYSHFIIRYDYYEQVKNKLIPLIDETKVVVVLTQGDEMGSMALNQRHVSLSLFCFQIVNILNNEKVVYSYGKQPYEVGQINPLPFARILVVDDNETNLYVAKGLMSSYRMQIDTAISGYEALVLVQKHKYDLIFMDHMMPEMDGVDTTKKIRGMVGEYYRSVPIVALTANAMSGARETFMSQGFDDFLAKPIEYKELNRVLRELVLPNAPEDYKETLIEQDDNEQVAAYKITEDVIEGIQMKKIIEKFGGDVVLYLNVLQTYLQDIKNAKIELISLYEEKDVDNFIICVHGLKSASYNVGANTLGKYSELLEKASKEKDYNWVRHNFNEYIEEMERIADAVEAYLTEKNKSSLKTKGSQTGRLTKETLLLLRTLCDDMDFVELEEQLERLNKYTYAQEEQNLLNRLETIYSQFEYEEFIQSIDQYLEDRE